MNIRVLFMCSALVWVHGLKGELYSCVPRLFCFGSGIKERGIFICSVLVSVHGLKNPGCLENSDLENKLRPQTLENSDPLGVSKTQTLENSDPLDVSKTLTLRVSRKRRPKNRTGLHCMMLQAGLFTVFKICRGKRYSSQW